MTPQQKSEVLELKRRAIDGMTRYMKLGSARSETDPDYDPTFNAGYSQKHIDKCARVLDGYIDALDRINEDGQDAKVLRAAEKAVVALNALNERCDGALIETDQREQICELLLVAAKHAGLKRDGDFTEEWREW